MVCPTGLRLGGGNFQLVARMDDRVLVDKFVGIGLDDLLIEGPITQELGSDLPERVARDNRVNLLLRSGRRLRSGLR
jgi:hypothetical protein